MTSLRNNLEDTETAVLEAAQQALLDVGWRNVTLTEVARRAGVSRMTVYRRWPDLKGLLGDLLTRQWTDLLEEASPEKAHATPRGIADVVVALITAMPEDPLFRRLLGSEPELVLPYLTQRRGRSQDLLLAALTALIESGQRARQVRRASTSQQTTANAESDAGSTWPSRVEAAVEDTNAPRFRTTSYVGATKTRLATCATAMRTPQPNVTESRTLTMRPSSPPTPALRSPGHGSARG